MKRESRAFLRVLANLRKHSFELLVEHFVHRLFGSEAFSIEEDLRVGTGVIAALLALPGLILPILLLPKYSSFLRWLVGVRGFDFNTASIPDKYTFVTFTMVVMGIVTALKWDSMLPNRLDHANLTLLPISIRRVFVAKFIALLLFGGLFIFALNAVSTFLFPFVAMSSQTRSDMWSLWLRFVVGHAAATVGGSAFMFFCFLALAGLLMTVLPHRRFRQVSTIVQFAAVILLVLLLFFTPEIGGLIGRGAASGHTLLGWLPTVWFLGLYQTLSSARAGANFDLLSVRAGLGLAIAAAASLLFYTLSYKRFFLRIPEFSEVAGNGQEKLAQFRDNCLDAFAPRPRYERACFRFSAKTLARSQQHTLFLAGFAGLGMAIAIQGVAGGWNVARGTAGVPGASVLGASTAVIFFLFTGLMFVFAVPAELRANWIFLIIGGGKSDVAQRVIRRWMLVMLSPLVAISVLVSSAAWGARLGVEHAAFILAASWLLIEVLLTGCRKIPFTCSFSTAKYNLGIVLAVYAFAFLIFSPGLAIVEHWTLSSSRWVQFFMMLAILAAAAIGVRWYGGKLELRKMPLLFADEREPLVPSMDLR